MLSAISTSTSSGTIGFFIVVFLGSVGIASAQLPPEIMADAYLLQMEQAIRDGDLDRGRTVIRKIRTLQNQHELELEVEFYFKYARAADAVGMSDVALESIVKYLAATGREGQYYDEALKMMNKAQSASSAIDISAHLSPNIRADGHLSGAEEAIGSGDLERARTTVQHIRNLEEQHELDLPDAFHFRYAMAANSVQLPEQALESVMKYLAVSGREGQHYVEALELMNQAQMAVSCRGWDSEEYFKTATVKEVTACLDTGIDANSKDDSGVTPLHRAVKYSDNADVIKYLLNSGVDIAAKDNDERTSLHWAVGYENVVAIKALIEAGADPNVEGKDKQTPLLVAVKKTDNPEVIEFLLDAGANEEARDNDERTPLHLAVQSNNTAAITALIKAEVNLEAKDEDGRTPLYHAVEDGHSNAIGLLVKAGADRIHAKPRWMKWTALHWSVTYIEDPAAIKAMLSAGARLKAKDKLKNRPIHLAAKFNRNPEISRILIRAGADVNAKSSGKLRPLHYAALYNDNPEVAKILIRAGADPNAKLNGDYTPLHLAAIHSNNPNVVKALLDFGANLNARLETDDTPLHRAAWNNENPDVIKLLLAAGADPNAKARGDWTPLHRAAESNENPAIVGALLDAGAYVNAAALGGQTPLHLAARYNENPDVIRLLLDAGANPNAVEDDDWTPLHLAARYNDSPVVIKALLDAGVDPNAKQWDNWTPLHLAARFNKNPDVIKALLDAGAHPNAKTSRRYSPLHLAAIKGSSDVVRTLINAGANLQARDVTGDTPLDNAEQNDNHAVARLLASAGAERTARSQPKQEKKGTNWGKVALGVLGGAAIIKAGKDAPKEVVDQALTDWVNVMAEGEPPSNAPVTSGASASQTQGAPAGDRMQQALLNLESICGEKYRSGFSANDHYRFYCMAAFNDYCALKRAQTEDAKIKLRASLTQNCGVLKGIGAAGNCSYCQ